MVNNKACIMRQEIMGENNCFSRLVLLLGLHNDSLATRAMTFLLMQWDAIKKELTQAGVQDPRKDIETIKAYLRETHGDTDDAKWEAAFHALLQRRLQREPCERITGRAHFFEDEFRLTPHVFKPGFETETTVEYAMLAAEAMNRPVHILDLGTGTGCMLITMLKQLPHATGVGVDITDEALSLATENAARHGVADRAQFIKSDWTAGLDDTFDIVISNPPRIPGALIPELVKEVSAYDPWAALDGGPDGLEFYERLAQDFRRIGKPDAQAFIQVGQIIAPQAAHVFVRYGYGGVALKTDYKYAPNCVTFHNQPMPEQPQDKGTFLPMMNLAKARIPRIIVKLKNLFK